MWNCTHSGRRNWADGVLCYSRPATPGSLAPVTRVANYLQPPIDNTPGSIATIGPGVRDAVILEVSREELSAFQLLFARARVGGPYTTERMHLRTAFKLFRLAAGETCASILDALRGDLAGKGRLTVRLEPTVNVPGDCPVVAGGGYTGFEHFLYRIEIAALNPAQHPAFKWSQFNGGLVGRGRLSTTPNRITITANQAAIVNSGLSVFYCEVLDFDEDRWLLVPSFGAHVTLSGSQPGHWHRPSRCFRRVHRHGVLPVVERPRTDCKFRQRRAGGVDRWNPAEVRSGHRQPLLGR